MLLPCLSDIDLQQLRTHALYIQIMMHDADAPNAVIGFLDCRYPISGRDIDLLATGEEAAVKSRSCDMGPRSPGFVRRYPDVRLDIL